MSDNFRQFDVGLKRFSKRNVPEAVRKFRNAKALSALKGVVMLSPVDQGRLRGNWQVSLGDAFNKSFDMNKFDRDGSTTIGVGAGVIAASRDPFEAIWIHNGVPYAVYVNDGTAHVRAVRMVERTASRLGLKKG